MSDKSSGRGGDSNATAPPPLPKTSKFRRMQHSDFSENADTTVSSGAEVREVLDSLRDEARTISDTEETMREILARLTLLESDQGEGLSPKEARAALRVSSPEFKRLVAKVEDLADEATNRRNSFLQMMNSLEARIALLEKDLSAIRQIDKRLEELEKVRESRSTKQDASNESDERFSRIEEKLERLMNPSSAGRRVERLEKTLLRLHASLTSYADEERRYEPVVDDLRQIRGIGAATARKLQRLGIDSFEGLAALDDAAVESLSSKLRVSSDKILGEWIPKARQLSTET